MRATTPNGRLIPRSEPALSRFGRVVVSKRDSICPRRSSEEDKQESIQTEDSAPEGARISNQAPEGETSTMVVVKWSDKV